MRILLDTNAAIWAVSASDRLPDDLRALIEDPANDVYISTCSLLEIAIKSRLARRTAPPFTAAVAREQFVAAGFEFLDVRSEHAVAVETLKLDHGDPFDRLILAQALTEPLRLVTKDSKLAAYSDTVISW